MKKFFAMLCAGVMALSMAACSSSGDKYIIATDTAFPPFEFTDVDGDGQFKGIDVDIVDAIAQDQGFEYEFDSIGFDAALAAVQSGLPVRLSLRPPVLSPYVSALHHLSHRQHTAASCR